MDAETKDELLIALNRSAAISREAICRLSTRPESWVDTRPSDFAETAGRLGIKPSTLRRAIGCRRFAHREALAERTRCRDLGGRIVTRNDPRYPAALFDLELPPPVLYVRGTLESHPGVSVVGSRRTDPYGIEVAERFSGELAETGLVIISGLALGVDSAAHRGALALGGPTLAVLGCGLDIDYPRTNRRLIDQLAEGGGIVTEFPMGTEPAKHHFPIRNRLIAALGCGTLVVRGTVRSGSLITAGQALGLGRIVWAIPGNIFDPRSMGPNSLIRDGAHPVQTSAELLETLPISIQQALENPGRDEGIRPSLRPERTDLRAILDAVQAGETPDADTLAAETGIGLEAVLAALVELEILGHVRRYPGPVWGRSGCPPRGEGE